MKHKSLMVLCALIAVLTISFSMIGGTLAYLKQVTPEIKNIFELGELGYELIFDANAPEGLEDSAVQGMPVPNPQTSMLAATEWSVETDAPTLSGYQFLGWANSETAAEDVVDYPLIDGKSTVTVEYDENDSYDPETATTSKTVYAIWKKMDFVVHFDTQTDGEVENPADMKITYKEAYGKHAENGELPSPVRTGYTFAGWALDKDGEKLVTKDTTVDIASDHTLYAQWREKQYCIRYHSNGGEGEMEDQWIKYNTPTTLYKNTFTREHYTFMGWSLNPSDTKVEYIDEQTVVALLDGGYLDLYAVWEEKSITVTFDYNGGSGTPASKQVVYNKAYGVLPEYPIRETEKVSDNEIKAYLFTGWYTEKDGGTRVYPSDIVDRDEDHTLFAHWEIAPFNNVIKNLTVRNNPDDDKDGVVDDLYINLTCSANFEKLNIPLENLIPGQKYQLSFDESNDATYGDVEKWYGGAIYGFIITKDKTLTAGSIKEESISDNGLIKEWKDRFTDLNGPRHWETTFTAEASTMYWTWDYGLILDGISREYNYTNIQLVPVAPVIEFNNKTLLKGASSTANIVSQSNTKYSTVFEFDGDSGCETVYYPITGLTTGSTYTITFDHQFEGKLIDDMSSENVTEQRYEYGCGIMTSVPTKTGDKMSNLGTFASGAFVLERATNGIESVTLEFKATGETAYWVWNLANVSDSKNGTIKVRVTEFSANHSDKGSITYHTATSYANSVAVVSEVPELPVIFVNNLPDEVEVSGVEDVTLGQDWALTLTGDDLPDILLVSIDSWPYVTGLNAELVQSCADVGSATSKAEWMTENADGSQTLTIPAEMMTSSATIIISGNYYDTYTLSELLYENLN